MSDWREDDKRSRRLDEIAHDARDVGYRIERMREQTGKQLNDVINLLFVVAVLLVVIAGLLALDVFA